MMKQCKPFQDPYQIFKAFNLISKLNNVVQKLSTASNTQKKNSSIVLSGLLTTNYYLSHLFFIFIFLFSLKDKCTKTVTIRSSTNILGLFSFSLKCKNYLTFSSPASGVSSSSSAFSFWVKKKINVATAIVNQRKINNLIKYCDRCKGNNCETNWNICTKRSLVKN